MWRCNAHLPHATAYPRTVAVVVRRVDSSCQTRNIRGIDDEVMRPNEATMMYVKIFAVTVLQAQTATLAQTIQLKSMLLEDLLFECRSQFCKDYTRANSQKVPLRTRSGCTINLNLSCKSTGYTAWPVAACNSCSRNKLTTIHAPLTNSTCHTLSVESYKSR